MSKNNTLWLGIALIFFSSCRAFYQSAPVPTPVLREKGDGDIFLSLHDLQASYAITKNIGISVSGHLDNRKKSIFSDTSGVLASIFDNSLENLEPKGYHSLQGGAIFFHPLDATKSAQVGIMSGIYQPSMMIEVSRGLFKKNTDESLKYKCIKSDFFLNFIHSSKYIDLITSLKLTGIQYNEMVYTEPLVAKELKKMDINQYPTLKSTYFFIEPSATLRYGFDNFKFNVQAFYSESLSDIRWGSGQMGIAWGINYQFNTTKTKKTGRRKMKV
jgi:hypothetical protein